MKEGEGGTDFQVCSIPNLLQDLSSTGGGEHVPVYTANQVAGTFNGDDSSVPGNYSLSVPGPKVTEEKTLG